MKICLVTDKVPKYKRGGAERQFFLIGQTLANRGHNVHMTCRKFKDTQPSKEVIDGVTVHSYGPTFGKYEPIKDYLLTKNGLLKALHQADCDVYNNTPSSPLTGWTRLYTTLRNKPFVFTAAHKKDCTKEYWKTKKGIRRRTLYEYGLKRADKRIVLAEYMREKLNADYGIDSSVIRYGDRIPDNVDFDKKEKRVIWLARFQDWKRPELFIKLAKNIDAPEWTFHLIGFADDEKYESKLAKMTESVDNLSFEGRVDPGKDMMWYRRAGLFVNTSTAEGFPNSYIQSWIHGTPVAALEVDPDGLIQKYGAGIQEQDFERFSDQIERILDKKSCRQSMFHNARELGEKFDIERTASNYFDIYQNLTI
jgi:glycosyltransferase involved in cell wall biosynthesis